jgi:GDP-4-dehydro-6-deoxy-D-mannose reductase
MRAVITGAKGFVGRHLREHLELHGDEVLSLDLECDVTNLQSISPVIQSFEPDAIYHLAALTHVGDSWDNPEEFNRVNVEGTRNILTSAKMLAHPAKVLFVSTADVYGIVKQSDLPLEESRLAAPANPYSKSKLAAEQLCQDVSTSQEVVIARPFNHIGPGQSAQFVIPALVSRLLAAASNGDASISVGDLSTRRDFCDVRDVVKAYRSLMQHGKSGEVYNIASGNDVSIQAIGEQLVSILAPDVKLVVDQSLLRPIEIPVMRGSYKKIHAATNWKPTISLESSLGDVITDLRSNSAKNS